MLLIPRLWCYLMDYDFTVLIANEDLQYFLNTISIYLNIKFTREIEHNSHNHKFH